MLLKVLDFSSRSTGAVFRLGLRAIFFLELDSIALQKPMFVVPLLQCGRISLSSPEKDSSLVPPRAMLPTSSLASPAQGSDARNPHAADLLTAPQSFSSCDHFATKGIATSGARTLTSNSKNRKLKRHAGQRWVKGCDNAWPIGV